MRIASSACTRPWLIVLASVGCVAFGVSAQGQGDSVSKSRDGQDRRGAAVENAVANVRIAKGFQLDLIYTVPRRTQGSWVALCTDPKGRLIAADQNGKLYRLTPPGRAVLDAQRDSWREFVAAINSISGVRYA